MDKTRPKISVVIIGKNEEKNIGECLGSVSGWADEIVFVDDQSTDSTVELVKKEETAVIFQRKMDMEGKQRNFGAQKASNDWIMILDCDERATPEVKKEIDDLFVEKDEKEVAFWIPRKNYMGDVWLRWGGWYPAPHVKLYDRRYFGWKECVYDVVHPGVEFTVPGYRAGNNLKNHMIHYNYRNIEDFIRKTNNLTTLDAIKWFLDGRQMSMARGLRRFVDRFLRRYLRKKGYRDGYYGFVASFLSGFYELAAYSKYREIMKKGYYLEEHGITGEIISNSKWDQRVDFSKPRRIIMWFGMVGMIWKVVSRNLRSKKFEGEVYFLKRFIGNDSVCLDIGGAYGRYAYPMAKIAAKGRIMSFEPGKYSFTVLRAVKAVFRMKNVDVFKKALGAENKKAFLVSPIKAKGKIGRSLSYVSDMPVPGALCEIIEVVTIDDLLKDAGLDRLDLVKCDTEGYEMTILRGGKNTIKKYRPVVLAEIEENNLRKYGGSPLEVASFFKDMSYRIFRLKDGKFLEETDIGEDSNYFFVPQEKSHIVE